MNSAAAAFSAPPAAPAPGGAGAGAAPSPAPAAAGTPAAPAPAAGTPASPAPAPAAGTEQWFSSIQNEDARNWVQAKGFKDGASAAESAFNLEKLLGHERAGRTLVLPKDDASPEELKAFNAKLGVPDSPDGYKLPVPEGQDPAFSKTAAGWMHEAGVTPKAAEKLAGKWNEHLATQAQEQQAAFAKKADTEFGEAVAEWGQKADENLAMGKRAASTYVPGANPAERQANIAKIEQAIGTKAMLTMFAAMGGNLGEHQMRDSGGGGGGMTPEAAKVRITELKRDADWGKRYVQGGAAEKKEMEQLHKVAFPEMT